MLDVLRATGAAVLEFLAQNHERPRRVEVLHLAHVLVARHSDVQASRKQSVQLLGRVHQQTQFEPRLIGVQGDSRRVHCRQALLCHERHEGRAFGIVDPLHVRAHAALHLVQLLVHLHAPISINFRAQCVLYPLGEVVDAGDHERVDLVDVKLEEPRLVFQCPPEDEVNRQQGPHQYHKVVKLVVAGFAQHERRGLEDEPPRYAPREAPVQKSTENAPLRCRFDSLQMLTLRVQLSQEAVHNIG
mmetsp:Transcript_32872/g.84570  ORF Transcript_32872/g.84570 Transcript_32872/m.84570 type:complete len:244 (-) Transcript_32872:514-1245(-)